MGRPGDIDDSIHQRQTGTLVLLLRVKSDNAAEVASPSAGIGGGDDDRAVGPLRSGGHVQCVKPLNERRAVLLRARHQKQRPGSGINDWRAHNSHVAAEILIIAPASPGHVRVARRHRVWPKKTDVPVSVTGQGIVRIEGVNRIVDRGDNHNIARPVRAEVHIGHDQRLGVNLVIHRPREHEAKLVRVDIGDVQDGFRQVRTRAGQVIVLGKNGDIRPSGAPEAQDEKRKNGTCHGGEISIVQNT